MNLLEAVPASLAPTLPAELEPRVALVADLDAEGRFGEAWVGADDRQVVALYGPGRVLAISLADVEAVEVEELFGASRLVVRTGSGTHVLATYTRNLVAEFAAMARALDDLREGREVTLPAEIPTALCPKCGSPLPERGATCPRCLSRRGVLVRLLGVLEPYRGRMALLVTSATRAVGA